MKIEIKSVFGSVLFAGDFGSIAEALACAIKSGADLYGADLYGADLTDADLTDADLHDANLTRANLTRANLTGADLYDADLTRANLTDANLYGADLTRANLTDANLYGADLTRANLTDANLYGAKNTELVISRTRILPDGDIIGWKQCKGKTLVKLCIPASAKRSHAFGRKCRAEYAEVLEIIGDNPVSQHDSSFVYKIGETVRPKEPFDEDWTKECASGIHFFITRIEAENY